MRKIYRVVEGLARHTYYPSWVLYCYDSEIKDTPYVVAQYVFREWAGYTSATESYKSEKEWKMSVGILDRLVVRWERKDLDGLRFSITGSTSEILMAPIIFFDAMCNTVVNY